MLTSAQDLPSALPSAENISILLATTELDDKVMFEDLLEQNGWEIATCGTATDALNRMADQEPAVVICDCDLPDGGWKRVLEGLQRSGNHPPSLLVISHEGDQRLWGEVLNLGGYDVLLKPLNESEVTRIVDMAWQSRVRCNPCLAE